MNKETDSSPGFICLLKCIIPLMEFYGENPDNFLNNFKVVNKRLHNKKIQIQTGIYKRKLERFQLIQEKNMKVVFSYNSI